jgi:DNA-binding transcriptional LysR family regulator
MEHWDNIRFFLAVVQNGSVRSASIALNVNHATVLRRIAQLEAQLGASLFDKLPTGYELTKAGDEILEYAERMAQTSADLQTQVFARDQKLTGKLCIALPNVLATDLFMPDLAEFSHTHPEIELQIVASYELVNLTKRQADVALRLVYDRNTLPQHLYGVGLQDVYRGVYIARDAMAVLQQSSSAKVKWILKEEDGVPPEWADKATLAIDTVPYVVSDMAMQLAAVRAGIGVTILPCFAGDRDVSLIRVPDVGISYYGKLWLLTHGETRKTKRVRLFCDFLKKRIKRYAGLLDGTS